MWWRAEPVSSSPTLYSDFFFHEFKIQTPKTLCLSFGQSSAVGQAVQLALSIAKYPEECMLADRKSAYYSTFSAKSFEDALLFEHENGKEIIVKEAIKGETTRKLLGEKKIFGKILFFFSAFFLFPPDQTGSFFSPFFPPFFSPFFLHFLLFPPRCSRIRPGTGQTREIQLQRRQHRRRHRQGPIMTHYDTDQNDSFFFIFTTRAERNDAARSKSCEEEEFFRFFFNPPEGGGGMAREQ